MTDIDTGLNAWQMTANHNRMIEIQAEVRPLTERDPMAMLVSEHRPSCHPGAVRPALIRPLPARARTSPRLPQACPA